MNFVQEFEITASIVFYIYLIWVSWQDFKEMQVVRYSHFLGMTALFLQIIQLILLEKGCVNNEAKEYLVAVLMLLLLQVVACWFKIYGIADAFVCCLCSVFFVLDKGIEHCITAYFMMQAIAGCMLLIVQFIKGNIKGVSLRQPVPYIPYISVAFFLTNMVL